MAIAMVTQYDVEVFQRLEALLGKKLEEYKGQDIGIWVTGHSLGGALATMMGAEILRRIDAGENYKLKGVYTFGSPRVGNNAFHAKFTKAAAASGTRVVRFRNGDDIVTAVPGLLLEYKHVGTLAHLSEDGLELPEKDPKYTGVGSVGDHNMSGWDAKKKAVTGYYRRLRKRLAELKPGAPFSTCPAN